jgi:hypothetical protein
MSEAMLINSDFWMRDFLKFLKNINVNKPKVKMLNTLLPNTSPTAKSDEFRPRTLVNPVTNSGIPVINPNSTPEINAAEYLVFFCNKSAKYDTKMAKATTPTVATRYKMIKTAKGILFFNVTYQ